MSELERASTPSQPVQPGARLDEAGSLPLIVIAACVLIGAAFGLVTVLFVWLMVKVLH